MDWAKFWDDKRIVGSVFQYFKKKSQMKIMVKSLYFFFRKKEAYIKPYERFKLLKRLEKALSLAQKFASKSSFKYFSCSAIWQSTLIFDLIW